MSNDANIDPSLFADLPPDAKQRQELEAEIIKIARQHPSTSSDCPDESWFYDWDSGWMMLNNYYEQHDDPMMSILIVAAYLDRLDGWSRLMDQAPPCAELIDEFRSNMYWFMERIIAFVENRAYGNQ